MPSPKDTYSTNAQLVLERARDRSVDLDDVNPGPRQTQFTHNMAVERMKSDFRASGPSTVTFDVGGTITTKGDLLTRTSTALTRLAVGADGLGLLADSAQTTGLSWGAVVRVLDRVTTDTTVTNTVTETAVYTLSIPGGTLSTNKRLRLRLCGQASADGTNRTLTVRLKYGATTVVTNAPILFSGAANAGVHMEAVVTGDGGTGSQHGELVTAFGANASAAGGEIVVGRGTAAEDSTAAKNLVVTVQWSAAAVGLTYIMESAVLELA